MTLWLMTSWVMTLWVMTPLPTASISHLQIFSLLSRR
jgi:hypothetical protein